MVAENRQDRNKENITKKNKQTQLPELGTIMHNPFIKILQNCICHSWGFFEYFG